jgi:hypothetical protein
MIFGKNKKERPDGRAPLQWTKSLVGSACDSLQLLEKATEHAGKKAYRRDRRTDALRAQWSTDNSKGARFTAGG